LTYLHILAIKGYIWGHKVDELKSEFENENDKFDIILLADLVFNHNQHFALLHSCITLLSLYGEVSLLDSW
jgi:EEF1A N-terminal glycine/lysine methyltransferase